MRDVQANPSIQELTCLQLKFQWQGTTLDIAHYNTPQRVMVGRHPLNDIAIGLFPNSDKNYPLMVPGPNQGQGILLADHFQGYWTDREGRTHTLDTIRPTLQRQQHSGFDGVWLPLHADETLLLQVDDMEIDIRYVEPASLKVAAQQRGFDYLFWRLTAFSAIAHFAMVLMFQFVPSNPDALNEKALKGRFTKLIQAPPRVPPRPEPRMKIKARKKPPKRRIERSQKRSDAKTKRTQSNKRGRGRSRDVTKMGLLDALNNSIGKGTGALFGRNNQNYLDNMMTFRSTKGTGPTLALTSCFGTNCNGQSGGAGMYGSPDDGWDQGYKGPKCKQHYSRGKLRYKPRRKKGGIKLNNRRIVLTGSLSKAQIARVIRRYWFHIKSCYDRALRRAPQLAGKITIRWIIGGNGLVQTASVKETTLGDETMENCLLRRIQRWRFPVPKGRGIVVVNYPFIFTAR